MNIRVSKNWNKKSHTCDGGGGTPQNFFLGFIDEDEKLFTKVTVDEGQLKMQEF